MLNNSQVEYDTLIPNNVSLSSDRRVLKALEKWHPGYIDWWKDLGPVGFQDKLVYLRTAINVDKDGWATFDYVKSLNIDGAFYLHHKRKVELFLLETT